jgi:hypothetical protein
MRGIVRRAPGRARAQVGRTKPDIKAKPAAQRRPAMLVRSVDGGYIHRLASADRARGGATLDRPT